MFATFVTICLFLIFVILVLALIKCLRGDMFYGYDDEVVTTTTTTVTHDEPVRQNYVVSGTLTIEHTSDGAAYVVDPVDNIRWYLNSGDDMYQDADGKIWRLV